MSFSSRAMLSGNRVDELGLCSALDLEQALPLLATLPNLEQLALSGSLPMKHGFRQIPTGLGKLRALKKLDLSGNQLRELPDDVFTLPGLEQLNLSENVLRALPPDIGQLGKLKELSLSFNRANPSSFGAPRPFASMKPSPPQPP